ncbi:MAG: hypothetical protein J2P57_12425, partial [Acidimicrobiaceae bacterium]|nr:hypothetical protein [Acidimicrobiaceae bacterium]
MGALIQLRTSPGSSRERSHRTPRDSTSQRSRLPAVLAVGLPMVVGLVHVGVVSPWYFVGSFDDDASYIMAAHALAGGHGMTATLPSGMVVASLYPPGYSALLAPLAWLWPHSFAPMRLLSVGCFALLFPLLWWYLERRGVGFAVRTAVLCVLALNPVLATYGTMVMAEAPFLVAFLVLLLLVDRWDGLSPAGASRRSRLITGTAVVLVAGAGVWLKEAAIGAVLGLIVWQLWRRRVWRAVAVAAGTVLLLVPVVVARIVAGVPIAGSRYSQELGGYYAGGLVGRVLHVAPHALWQTLTTALPASVVPYHNPLPQGSPWSGLWSVLSLHVSVFAVVGAVSWWRHHRDSAVMVIGVYLAETLLFPFINERRVVLVLPVVIAWYVIGALAVWRWLRPRVTTSAAGAGNRLVAALQRRPVALNRGAACLAAVAVIVPLMLQFPRDYLFAVGQSSSHPQG